MVRGCWSTNVDSYNAASFPIPSGQFLAIKDADCSVSGDGYDCMSSGSVSVEIGVSVSSSVSVAEGADACYSDSEDSPDRSSDSYSACTWSYYEGASVMAGSGAVSSGDDGSKNYAASGSANSDYSN